MLFYSPEDISEANEAYVKLKVAIGDASTSVEYGAEVFDKNDRLVGTVDYPVNDTLTGEVKKFKVKTASNTEGILFSVDDIDKSTPDKVRLKIAIAR